MKIYTKIKIDMGTGRTVEEESFEYSGPLALCIALLPAIGFGIGALGLMSNLFGDDDDDEPDSYIPPHLEAFWKEFMDNWFGVSGSNFKNMIMEDINFQKGVYDSYLKETKGYTEEYRGKLEDLENTYTNRPYTFNFQILGQTVKNIPKRSLMTISTLSDLATKRYGAGVGQSTRGMQGGMTFTPNRGERDYMSQMMKFLSSAPGYNRPPDQGNNGWWNTVDTATKWYDLVKNIYDWWND